MDRASVARRRLGDTAPSLLSTARIATSRPPRPSWSQPSSVQAASPNGPCFGDESNFYDGNYVDWTGAAATEFKINSVSPVLCTGRTDVSRGSVTWTALVGPGSLDIIQLGVGRCVAVHVSSSGCDDTNRLVYAWGRTRANPQCNAYQDAFPRWKSLGAAPGGTNTFTVIRTTTQWRFLVNGSEKTTIGLGNICWTPTTAEYFGETWDRGDQMGGTVGTRQHFTNALYERSVGGSWFSPSFSTCLIFPSRPEYSCSRLNGQAIDIWTDRS